MAARCAAGIRRRRPGSDEPLRDHGRGRAHGGDPVSLCADLRAGSAAGIVPLQRGTEETIFAAGDRRQDADLLCANRARCRQRSSRDEDAGGKRRRSLHYQRHQALYHRRKARRLRPSHCGHGPAEGRARRRELFHGQHEGAGCHARAAVADDDGRHAGTDSFRKRASGRPPT